MKQGKAAAIIFTVMDIILIALFAALYVRLDRTEPRFGLQESDLIYTEDIEQTELLQLVTAYDDKDGDVTEHIVIEKIVENESSDMVVVFYAVSDRAGNVAKTSKVFPAQLQEEEKEEMEEI